MHFQFETRVDFHSGWYHVYVALSHTTGAQLEHFVAHDFVLVLLIWILFVVGVENNIVSLQLVHQPEKSMSLWECVRPGNHDLPVYDAWKYSHLSRKLSPPGFCPLGGHRGQFAELFSDGDPLVHGGAGILCLGRDDMILALGMTTGTYSANMPCEIFKGNFELGG